MHVITFVPAGLSLNVQTSLDNLVPLGKLGNKLFSTKSVYWLTSEFATTQKATPTRVS